MGDKEKMGTKKKGGSGNQRRTPVRVGNRASAAGSCPCGWPGRAAATQELGMAGSPEFARGNGQGSVSLAASLLNLQVLQNPLGPTLSRQVIRVWHRQYHTICPKVGLSELDSQRRGVGEGRGHSLSRFLGCDRIDPFANLPAHYPPVLSRAVCLNFLEGMQQLIVHQVL